MKDEKLINKTIELIKKAISVVPLIAKDLMIKEAENNGYVLLKDEDDNYGNEIEIKLSNGQNVCVWIPEYCVKTTYKTQKGFNVSSELEKLLDLNDISKEWISLIKEILIKSSQEDIKKNFPVLWRYVSAAMVKTDNMATLKQKWKQLYKDTEEFCNRVGIMGA